MVRVALLQLRLQKDEKEAMEHVARLVKNAGVTEPDIVCLPEQWYPRPIKNFDHDLRKLASLASEAGLVVIAGAFVESMRDAQGGEHSYISCPVIGSDGRILGRQLKIHPFGEEKRKVRAGTKLEVFEAGNFRFGVGVCHDVVFPEIARAFALKGADLLFFPSRIRKEGIEPWHIYVQARALENRIPVAAPNACNKVFGGRSIVVDFAYDKAANVAVPQTSVASVNEQLVVMDVDLEQARRIRRMRFEDYRSDLYRSL